MYAVTKLQCKCTVCLFKIVDCEQTTMENGPKCKKKMHITSSLFKCGYKNIHYVLHMTVKILGHAACKFIV